MAQVLIPSKFRSGMQMLLTGLVIFAAAAGAWCYWGHHLWTALKGPVEITLADLAKTDDPSKLPSTWVKVKFDRAVKSEYVMEETRNGVKTGVKEEYLIFQAGERWMIAVVPPSFKGNELSGQVWRQSFGISREAVAKITEELKDVHHGKLFPFEFDAGENYAQKWEMTAGIIGFFAACGIFFSGLGVAGIQQGYKPPRPEWYGLPAELYADLVIETPEQARAAVQMFMRDAGLGEMATDDI